MSKQLFYLTGKVALVTGATHGLGLAMAKGIGKSGATIIINGNSSQEKIDKAVEIFKSEGIRAFGYRFDVTNEDEVQNAIPLVEMEVVDFEQVIKVDLVSPFIVSKAVVKGMIQRKAGKIINICSMMSELGRNTVGAYAAAKGGLKMLTQNMCVEWAPHNIQVNGIGPGYFATEQTKPIRVDGHPFNEFIVNRTPAGVWGDPDELQGAAVFLSSSASNFVTGQILYVDGGILATIGKPSNE
jgi:gluconate 5-dehydrogenase